MCSPLLMLRLRFLKKIFFYFILLFLAVCVVVDFLCGLSLVVMSRGYFSLWCTGVNNHLLLWLSHEKISMGKEYKQNIAIEHNPNKSTLGLSVGVVMPC